MKNATVRMSEFIHYHLNGDGECNNIVLKWIADRRGLGKQERYELAYMFAITYAVESALILLKNCREGSAWVNRWKGKKDLILFQSDRKYMRMGDRFDNALTFFTSEIPDSKIADAWVKDGTLDLETAIQAVEKWYMFGRFSAFLFLETYAALMRLKVRNTTIIWKDGDTATSGIMNLFGFDEQADLFDQTGKIAYPLNDKKLDEMLSEVFRNVEKCGEDASLTEIETSLCAYRKFYKGTRYNGYYLDRMLEEVYEMRERFPEETEEILQARAACFRFKYLGEIGGWKGIRKDLKKAYKTTGIIT